MKKLLILAILFTSFQSFAQTADNPWAVGLHMGTMEYRGDLGSEYFKFSNLHLAGGISVSKYISPSFDLMGTFSHGIIDYGAQRVFRNRTFNTKIYNLNFLAKYKFNNGKLLDEDFVISPHIVFGFGDAYSVGTYYSVPVSDNSGNVEQYKREDTNMYFNFPLGIGIAYPVNENFSINLTSVQNYVITDRYDGVEAGDFNDQFIMHSIGFQYFLK